MLIIYKFAVIYNIDIVLMVVIIPNYDIRQRKKTPSNPGMVLHIFRPCKLLNFKQIVCVVRPFKKGAWLGIISENTRIEVVGLKFSKLQSNQNCSCFRFSWRLYH